MCLCVFLVYNSIFWLRGLVRLGFSRVEGWLWLFVGGLVFLFFFFNRLLRLSWLVCLWRFCSLMLLHVYPLNSRIVVIEIVQFFFSLSICCLFLLSWNSLFVLVFLGLFFCWVIKLFSYSIDLVLLCREIMAVTEEICWPSLRMRYWSNAWIVYRVLDWKYQGKVVFRVTFSIDWLSLKVTKFYKERSPWVSYFWCMWAPPPPTHANSKIEIMIDNFQWYFLFLM